MGLTPWHEAEDVTGGSFPVLVSWHSCVSCSFGDVLQGLKKLSSASCGKACTEGFVNAGDLASTCATPVWLHSLQGLPLGQVTASLWQPRESCGDHVICSHLLQKGTEPRELVLCADLALRLVWAHSLNGNCWGRENFSGF